MLPRCAVAAAAREALMLHHCAYSCSMNSSRKAVHACRANMRRSQGHRSEEVPARLRTAIPAPGRRLCCPPCLLVTAVAKLSDCHPCLQGKDRGEMLREMHVLARANVISPSHFVHVEGYFDVSGGGEISPDPELVRAADFVASSLVQCRAPTSTIPV